MPSPVPALSQDRMQELERDRLTPMIEQYSNDVMVQARLTALIDGSPALKEGLLYAIDKGAFDGFVAANAQGAIAAYDVQSKQMMLPTAVLDDPYRATFVIGHETGHAVDRAINGDHTKDVFIPGARQMLHDSMVTPGPRDYTGLIRDAIADDRRNESEAQISGFNALASRLTNENVRHNLGVDDPLQHRAVVPTPAEMYAAYPDMMRDFMIVRGEGVDRTFTLKPGLTLDDQGKFSLDTSTAQGRDNIEAMKVYFADKLPSSLGPNGALNYPHKALLEGLDLAHKIENIPDPSAPNFRPKYVVDFDNLGFELNGGLMRTPQSSQISIARDFDATFMPLMRSEQFAHAVTGAQGLLGRRLLEQATTALEGVDEQHLGGVQKGTPEFSQLCAYTARVAGENRMTTIGSVMHSEQGGLIVCNKANVHDPSARLLPFDPANAQQASGPEHMRKLGEATGPMLLDAQLEREREALRAQQAQKKSDNCVVM